MSPDFFCLGNVCRGAIKIFYGDSDRSLILSNYFSQQHRISNYSKTLTKLLYLWNHSMRNNRIYGWEFTKTVGLFCV